MADSLRWQFLMKTFALTPVLRNELDQLNVPIQQLRMTAFFHMRYDSRPH